MNLYWPIALIVLSNVFYHISSKQTPDSINPLASLTVTYAVATVASGALFFLLNRGGNLIQEYHHLNWTSFILGVAVVGLEAGSIYMYKAGWNINTGHLFHSAILSIALIFVGYFLYHEAITLSKVLGIVFCLVGLFFISR
ncbi:MAG: EamA family transporter [Oscillibacter sp.]|nr:EamA family transporter [Oscillibacter sp.]